MGPPKDPGQASPPGLPRRGGNDPQGPEAAQDPARAEAKNLDLKPERECFDVVRGVAGGKLRQPGEGLADELVDQFHGHIYPACGPINQSHERAVQQPCAHSGAYNHLPLRHSSRLIRSAISPLPGSGQKRTGPAKNGSAGTAADSDAVDHAPDRTRPRRRSFDKVNCDTIR